MGLCITLISASVAESAHGDESVATSTPPDAATMPLTVEDSAILPAVSAIIASSTSGTSITATDTISANISTSTPIDTNSAAESASADQIQTYSVKSGDTLSGIAARFNISVNTIVWANNINPKSTLKNGQTLVILPISGVEYKVVSGDTIQSIAKKFKGDVDEIVAFNNLQDAGHVKAGDIVVIPDGEMSSNSSKPASKPSAVSTSKPVSQSETTPTSGSTQSNTANSSASLIRPVVGGLKTQGLHGHNAVDLADSLNTPIIASAAGTVIVAKSGGWNGGYGTYVVIDHGNGVQTLYAHMNSLSTSVGSTVSQGQTIGGMGQTGDATGVHLHFEVRGGVNPF